MKSSNRRLAILFMLFVTLFAVACNTPVEAEKVEPAKLEADASTGFNRVVLTEKAADRLQIETAEVTTEAGGTAVPYSSLVYGLNGETWVYIVDGPLTYMRAEVEVDHIDDDMVILTAGPDVGTEVVTVAVAELYGTDTGVGK